MSTANNTLFTEITPEESVAMSGGGTAGVFDFDLNTYIFVVGAGTLFGNPGLTDKELDYAWQNAITIKKNVIDPCNPCPVPNPCGVAIG